MKQRFAIFGAIIAVLIGVGIVISNQYHKTPDNTAPQQPSATVPQVPVNPGPSVPPTTSPQLPPPSTTPAKQPKQADKVPDAVTAAVLATNTLSGALLRPLPQIRQIVETLVVPSQQSKLVKAYVYGGQVLASAWKYPTVNDAQVSSNYFVNTLKYRVQSFSANHATISLYTVSHWIDAQNQEYQVPGITIIQMTWMKGRWLYAGAHDPRADQVPAPMRGLTFEQTTQRFQSYLKGFHDYAVQKAG